MCVAVPLMCNYFCVLSARRDMERIAELREELGDIKEALEMMHENQNNSDIGTSFPYLTERTLQNFLLQHTKLSI